MPIDKTCEKCGTAFTCPPSHQNRIKYCSRACYEATKRGNALLQPTERICKRCEKPFTTTSIAQKFCSAECRDGARIIRTGGGTGSGIYRRKSGVFGAPPVEKTCKHCGTVFLAKAAHAERRNFCSTACTAESRRQAAMVEKACIVCGNMFRSQPYRKVKCCSEECTRKSRGSSQRRKNPTGWHTKTDGYIAKTIGGRTVLQHRQVMEAHLGRALHKYENIHHKNGVKGDNRLENLEVWVTRQPKGQRPEDTDEWAIVWLQSRGYTVTKA